jgi:hypothetical protein
MMRTLGSVMCLTLAVVDCGCRGSTISPPTDFLYNGSMPFPAVVGEAIALTPAVSGPVDGYSVVPALPPGLWLDGLTGVVSGTPTTTSAPSAYTITAINAGGSAKFRLILSVAEPPSRLSYRSPVQVTVGMAIRALNPTVTGTVDHYAIFPALPAGLVIDAQSGTISGTPRVATNLMPYTITASSAAGRTDFVLLLTASAPSSHPIH